jgi:hypothetical protein
MKVTGSVTFWFGGGQFRWIIISRSRKQQQLSDNVRRFGWPYRRFVFEVPASDLS